MIKKKLKRPTIPIRTQIKLWTLAAGRCEFLGCNEKLWRDSLTFTEGNYSNIAHIISWTQTGPRGDPILSPKLATEFDNLMLLCEKHAKMIDEKKNIFKYTREKLRSFKKLHEDRIKIQTDINEERKTTVIRIQSNIRGRKVEVPQSDVYRALISENRYPNDEKGIFIDLTSLDYSYDSSFWDTALRQIESIVERGLSRGNDELTPTHISIFGLAPIPLLIYLGFKLGNTIPADIYVKTRGRNWYLTDGSPKPSRIRFDIKRPKFHSKPRDVVLAIAVSGLNSKNVIQKAIGRKSFPVYEMRTVRPSLDTIKSAEDLEIFRKNYRDILDEIRERCGKNVRIHLISAIPSCAAITCGREILHGVDPTLIVYEHGNQSTGLFSAIEVK